MTDTDNPQWTDKMFAKAQRGTATARRGPGRPTGSNKTSITIRFDIEVIETFGQGGQAGSCA